MKVPVYVDYQTPCISNRNWPWPTSCHLFADSADELHQFAASIGLKRSWFQTPRRGHPRPKPHYDMTPTKREQAVRAGAIELETRQQMLEVLSRITERFLHGEMK